jgi:hypothetical protein
MVKEGKWRLDKDAKEEWLAAKEALSLLVC